MVHIILAFSATLLSLQVRADDGPSDYFRTIPESKSLVHWGSARETALDSTSINVLIWNIKKAEGKTWKNEFSAYSNQKQILILQEGYDSAHFMNTTSAMINYRWDMGRSFTYVLYDNHATGTVIGSKVEPLMVKARHTVDLEPVTLTPKTLTIATYPLSQRNDSLLVVDVHGINFNNHQAFLNHLNQIKAEVSRHNGPVIVAGDFNTRTKDRTEAMNSIMKSLKLQPVVWKNGEKRMKAYLTPWYLDHAFVRGLKVSRAEVFGEAKGSDHKPMSLNIRLP